MLLAIIFILSQSAEAAQYQRLLNCNGVQQLLSHDGTGETSCAVLWDEKTSGPIPSPLPCEVGACELALKNGDWQLSENAELKAQLDAKKAADQKKEKDASDAKTAVRTLKAKLDADQALTAAEQRRLLKFLVEKLGDL